MIIVIGIIGVGFILTAFILNLLKKWDSGSAIYLITNIIGCTLAIIYDLLAGPTLFLVLQFVWGTFALVKLIQLWENNASKKTK